MKKKKEKKVIFIADYIDCSNLHTDKDGNSYGPVVCVEMSDTGVLVDEKSNSIRLDESGKILTMVPNCMFVPAL